MDFRDEIVESQKSRADFFKWKIILVAALGSLALGLESVQSAPPAPPAPAASHEYLLCLIPLVCLYVDLLCSHLNLRILVIGRFVEYASALDFKDTSARESAYEEFAEKARNLTDDLADRGIRRRIKERPNQMPTFSAFSFEDIALHISSGILSLFVLLWGCSKLCFAGYDGFVFIAAGLAGMVCSFIAYWGYWRRIDALLGLAEEMTETKSKHAPPVSAAGAQANPQ